MQEKASILEICLSRIAAGKATIQSCLADHPDLAGELEPLLRAAEWLHGLPKPTLKPQVRARIEDQLLETADRSLCPPVSPPRSRLFRLWRWAMAGWMVALLVALSGLGIMAAAEDALPGSPLYPVKRTVEQTWMWLLPAQDEPWLHLHLAYRRLNETIELASQGRFDPTPLTAMRRETEAVLIAAENLSPTAALELLEDLTALTTEQQRALSELVNVAPPPARGSLTAALQASARQTHRAQVLMGTLRKRKSRPFPSAGVPQPSGLTRTPHPPGRTRTPYPPGRTRT
ncbi:MAG: hypothetical protein D6759_13305, partial [Chloroflexi bacterium]